MPQPEHINQRLIDATTLIDDFNLGQDAEYFAAPERRLEFIASLSADEFVGVARHANARMRGFEPRDGNTTAEKGGDLPSIGTPSIEDKPVAFRAGFDTIKTYIVGSDDSVEEKIKGVGMAVEALIIWVHPFNDGNGRTSRFFGKFIESGAIEADQLIAETADNRNRMRVYLSDLRVDQANIAKGKDLILDDDQIERLRKTEMSADKGIALSIDRLLRNKAMQQKVEANTARHVANHKRIMARTLSAA